MKGSGDKNRLMQAVLFYKCEPGDILEWEINLQGEKRSLDANNYAWALLDKIAQKMRSTKWEIYLQMIEDYGTFVYAPCFEKDIPQMQKVFRVVRDRGVVELTTPSGKKVFCHQLQMYKGSSMFDTKEMSRFIDGIIYEAQKLGIQTDTPDEIERIKAAWKK